jgi:hypothetical protein
MKRADLHTLTGAYAVHAVTGAELVEFERHLRDCAACEEETRELSETATRLGLAVSRTASPAMREQVMSRIATVRQEPPLMIERPDRAERLRGRFSHGDRWGRGGVRSGARFALAASVVAATALGGATVWQRQQMRDAQAEAVRTRDQANDMSRVMAASDAVSRSGVLTGGGRAMVVMSHSENRAVIFASGLPSLEDSKVYQLWFADGDTMRSAGLMPDSARSMLLNGTVGVASGVGVTVEPAGGSTRPTTRPLAVLPFPTAAKDITT